MSEMTIHYQTLHKEGMKAAFVTEPQGDVDKVVRAALEICCEARILGEIITSCSESPYILDGADIIVYHNPILLLGGSASCTIMVPKTPGDVIVGIHTTLPFDSNTLEQLIRTDIDNKLKPFGLVPIESVREQIPHLLLNEYSSLLGLDLISQKILPRPNSSN